MVDETMRTCSKRTVVKHLQDLGVKRDIDELLHLSSFSTTIKDEFRSAEVEELILLDKLVEIFEEIDKDGSGAIDKTEIVITMHKLGYKVTQRQGEMMLKKVDTDGNSEISLQEFVSFFRHSPLSSINALAEQWAEGIATDCGGEVSPSLPPSGLEIWQTIVAGGCGGVASRTLTAPLEKIKLSAQTGTVHTSGMLQELSWIVQRQGFSGLFAGNFTNCIRVFPTAGIACTCYLNILKLTPADAEFDLMEPVYRLGCGGAAAFIANTMTYPMDTVRVRLTLAETKVNVFQVCRDISSNGGYSNFYRGLSPTLCAVVPFIAFQNTTIDLLRDYAISEGLEVNPLLLGIVGAGAGIVAQTVVYPLDVLRRRLQMTNNINSQANKEVLSDHMWTSVKQLVKEGGIKSLFAGIIPTYMKTIPAIAIFSSVAGSLNGYFKKQNATR